MTRAPERGTRTCTPAMHSMAIRPRHSADKPAVRGGSPSGGAIGTEVAVEDVRTAEGGSSICSSDSLLCTEQ